MNKSSRKLLIYSIAVIVSLFCICLVGAIAINVFGGTVNPTPAPIQVFDTSLPIPTLIALTYSAARTQTAIANPAPLIENIPTATIFISVLQTNNAAQPTEYIYLTSTPFSLATEPLQTIQSTLPAQSTLPPQSAVCSCSIDYNCPDFSSHSEAQACFDYCKSLGYDDPSGLDRDDDNLACEDTNY